MASTEPRASRFHAVVLPLLLLLMVFGVYAATTERHAINTDAYAASAGAWRIATAGTPWFDGLDVTEIEGTHGTIDGETKNGQWLSPSPNGHVAPQRAAGPIIAGVPLYWVLADGAEEQDFSLLPGGLTASLLCAVAVMLLFLAMRRQVSAPLALAGAIVFAFATPTWSTSANGLWTHPVTQLGIAGAAYAASRSRWWLAGVFLGVGMLGRPHLALVAAVLGLGVAWSRRDWRVAVRVAVPTAASLGLTAAWNRAVHGVWSITGSYTDAVDRAAKGVEEVLGEDLLTNYLGFLVSFDRGFLVWTPVVLLFLPALLRARRALPDWSLWLVLGGIVYTFVQIRMSPFHGGIGYHGYRLGLELLTCLVPALTFSAPYLGRVARRLVPIVITVQIAAFTIGATLEAYFVDLEDVWRDNSFWLALRYNPEVVGAWLAVCVAIGALIAFRYVPPVPDPAPKAAETAPDAPTRDEPERTDSTVAKRSSS